MDTVTPSIGISAEKPSHQSPPAALMTPTHVNDDDVEESLADDSSMATPQKPQKDFSKFPGLSKSEYTKSKKARKLIAKEAESKAKIIDGSNSSSSKTENGYEAISVDPPMNDNSSGIISELLLVVQRLVDQNTQNDLKIAKLEKRLIKNFDYLGKRMSNVLVMNGTLVESNIRQYMIHEYGESYVREFEVQSLAALIHLATPKVLRKSGNGFTVVADRQTMFLDNLYRSPAFHLLTLVLCDLPPETAFVSFGHSLMMLEAAEVAIQKAAAAEADDTAATTAAKESEIAEANVIVAINFEAAASSTAAAATAAASAAVVGVSELNDAAAEAAVATDVVSADATATEKAIVVAETAAKAALAETAHVKATEAKAAAIEAASKKAAVAQAALAKAAAAICAAKDARTAVVTVARDVVATGEVASDKAAVTEAATERVSTVLEPEIVVATTAVPSSSVNIHAVPVAAVVDADAAVPTETSSARPYVCNKLVTISQLIKLLTRFVNSAGVVEHKGILQQELTSGSNGSLLFALMNSLVLAACAGADGRTETKELVKNHSSAEYGQQNMQSTSNKGMFDNLVNKNCVWDDRILQFDMRGDCEIKLLREGSMVQVSAGEIKSSLNKKTKAKAKSQLILRILSVAIAAALCDSSVQSAEVEGLCVVFKAKHSFEEVYSLLLPLEVKAPIRNLSITLRLRSVCPPNCRGLAELDDAA